MRSSVNIIGSAAGLAYIAIAFPHPTLTTPSGELPALVEAYNASAQDVFTRVIAASGAPENVALSPASIGSAMAMALSGARNVTEREMLAALHLRLSRLDVDEANREWLTVLDAYAPARAAPLTVALANALAMTRRVSPAYAATLRTRYGAEIFAPASADAINAWVSTKTAGRIPTIVDRVPSGTAAVILDAIYFKGRWATRFDVHATTEDGFNVSASSRIATPTMHATGSYSMTAGEGYSAIRLPYDGNDASMIVVRPDEIGTTQKIAAALTGPAVARLVAALNAPARSVALALPRFSVRARLRLGSIFADLGMRRAFDPRQADFSGMTGQSPHDAPIALDDVVHSATIDVNEDGTEAAAATAIGARTTTGLRQRPVPFTVDRPFLFFVVHAPTGALLFQGRVINPRVN